MGPLERSVIEEIENAAVQIQQVEDILRGAKNALVEERIDDIEGAINSALNVCDNFRGDLQRAKSRFTWR